MQGAVLIDTGPVGVVADGKWLWWPCRTYSGTAAMETVCLSVITEFDGQPMLAENSERIFEQLERVRPGATVKILEHHHSDIKVWVLVERCGDGTLVRNVVSSEEAAAALPWLDETKPIGPAVNGAWPSAVGPEQFLGVRDRVEWFTRQVREMPGRLALRGDQDRWGAFIAEVVELAEQRRDEGRL